VADNFAQALAAIREMKSDGVVEEYAIGGAMAVAFWTEPTTTFDLDVFALVRQTGLLVSLTPIYDWAAKRGFPAKGEHIYMAGIPVQVIPAGGLAAEAVANATELHYENEAVRVIRPEYLIALSVSGSARTPTRVARAAQLIEGVKLDRDLLNDLVKRYNLRLPPT
jgi:hypothetical protein